MLMMIAILSLVFFWHWKFFSFHRFFITSIGFSVIWTKTQQSVWWEKKKFKESSMWRYKFQGLKNEKKNLFWGQHHHHHLWLEWWNQNEWIDDPFFPHLLIQGLLLLLLLLLLQLNKIHQDDMMWPGNNRRMNE